MNSAPTISRTTTASAAEPTQPEPVYELRNHRGQHLLWVDGYRELPPHPGCEKSLTAPRDGGRYVTVAADAPFSPDGVTKGRYEMSKIFAVLVDDNVGPRQRRSDVAAAAVDRKPWRSSVLPHRL